VSDTTRPHIKSFSLERDAWERLVLVDQDGQRYAGVEPIRAFPISDPAYAISIVDSEGRELIHVGALDDLRPAVREVIEVELARREFVPLVRRIVNDPPDSEPAEWTVETDRGVTTFQLESEDDVHRTDQHQFTIVDSHGIRYLIPDARKLDGFSRRVLDRFL
jgi:hypothetical protein